MTTKNRTELSVERLTALLERLEEEKRQPTEERATLATDAQLAIAIEQITEARDHLAQQGERPYGLLLKDLARHVADSWSYTSPLSREVIECALAARAIDTPLFMPGSRNPEAPAREANAGPKLWPKPVRYAIIITLVALVMIGVVTLIIGNPLNSAIIRLVMIPVLVATVLGPVQAVRTMKRKQRSKNSKK